MLSQILATRPRLENAMLQLDKSWAKLPMISLRVLYDDFDTKRVSLDVLPTGPWSSPICDVVMIAKLVACHRPRRILEVGSFRGYTTRIIAEHAPEGSQVVAVDRDPRHGEAYLNTPLADKIERRIGEITHAAFERDPKASYDFMFLDADHSYAAVKKDTDILLPLLANDGIIIWHDYGNWGRLSGRNGVPQYLHEAAKGISIAAIPGTWLAIHSPAWNRGARNEARFTSALQAARRALEIDVWATDAIRG